MSEEKIKILERALKIEKQARKQAEKNLELKSLKLYKANKKLTSTNKIMEALIEDEVSQMNIIFENSSLGIVLTEKGNLIKINKTFQNILGYSKDELKSLTIKDISHPGDLPESMAYIKKLENGEIDNFLIKDWNYNFDVWKTITL